MEIYLDNSATTRCYTAVKDIMVQTLMEDYGNPSSLHQKGVEAERYVREAAQQTAAALKCEPGEVFFTSGGTESNNWALVGAAMANRRAGNHIVTTRVEHPAVTEPVRYLEQQGFSVTRVEPEQDGRVSVQAVREALRAETILVSTVFVNNEIGAVNPVREIAACVHELSPQAVYHVDAIQAFGKYTVHPGRTGIDLLSVSGHKIHGPKGIGFLYCRKGTKLEPLIRGGGQQLGMRSGTDPVPGIAGLGEAVRRTVYGMDEKVDRMYALKEEFCAALCAMDDVVIHGAPVRESAPHIVSAAFLGVRSEVLLHALEDQGIFISAGSACSSHKRAKSPTLTAIGATAAQLESTVRFSFSEYTTREELAETVKALQELLPMLRRFSRK